MKSKTKLQDLAAASIAFGVELETAIPVSSGITVGGYHRGLPVTTAQATDGTTVARRHSELPDGKPNAMARSGINPVRCHANLCPRSFVDQMRLNASPASPDSLIKSGRG
jgi:hypothetical protein